ncbi:MAG: hypothetical protein J5I53_06405 [Bradyrhizobiaceae bacterium]|nr:hypothetical protein [Bradyrhizobiaceae bacterium]
MNQHWKHHPVRCVILGSGQGSTARAIADYAASAHRSYRIIAIGTTTPGAGILQVAREHGVPDLLFSGDGWEVQLNQYLAESEADLLILAGFLKLLPVSVIQTMYGRVVNTHPALLPAYGGKGMYGSKVHRAVAEAKETVTGVTLHWVNEEFDKGGIIEQSRVLLPDGATAEQVEQLVRQREREWLPEAIERLVSIGVEENFSTPSNLS